MNDVVERAYPFTPLAREQMATGITKLIDLYTKCVTREDRAQAERQLKIHQREQIAWDRDTVWRQMIGQERRGEQDGQLKSLGFEVESVDGSNIMFTIKTPVGPLKIKKKHIFLVLSVAIFVALVKASVLEKVEASNCFAILVFATILWATEVGPVAQSLCFSYFAGHPFVCDIYDGSATCCRSPGHTRRRDR